MSYQKDGMRSTDQNRGAWLIDQVSRWNWLITIILALLLALGFGFQTPKQKFDAIDNSTNDVRLEVKDLRLQVQESKLETKELRKLIEDVVTIECIKSTRSTLQARRILLDAQIPCARLLRERGLQ